MKTKVKSAGKYQVVKVSAGERQDRMHTYLKQTRPAFEESVAKARSLGNAANGVLAGRMARA